MRQLNGWKNGLVFWKARKKLDRSILTRQLTCIVCKLYRWLNFENIAWEVINNFWPWTSVALCSAAFDTFSPRRIFHSATLWRETLILKRRARWRKLLCQKKQKNVPLAASWEDFSRDEDGMWHTWSITIWVPEKAGWWSGCVCSKRVQRTKTRPKIQNRRLKIRKDSRSRFRLRVGPASSSDFQWRLLNQILV